MKNSSPDELLGLLPALARLACEAGKAILEVYDTDFSVDLKPDTSPITQADRRSNDLITAGLSQIPVSGGRLSILSEEGRDIPYAERKDWHRYWLVDPLDGTKEFVNRNGEFTVNIALIEARAPVLGVVYIPVKDVLYAGFAAGGGGDPDESTRGAFRIADAAALASIAAAAEDLLRRSRKLTGAPFSESTTSPGRVRVAGSRSHRRPPFEEFLEELRNDGRTVEVISAGSSLKFCLVAEGAADLYPRFGNTWEWDTAAGHAVARGAGRSVLVYGTQAELPYNRENLLNGPFICR